MGCTQAWRRFSALWILLSEVGLQKPGPYLEACGIQVDSVVAILANQAVVFIREEWEEIKIGGASGLCQGFYPRIKILNLLRCLVYVDSGIFLQLIVLRNYGHAVELDVGQCGVYFI